MNRAIRHLPLLLAATVLAGASEEHRCCGAELAAAINFFEPANLTATIYSRADAASVLFTFHRTATRSNSTVQVVREYNRPDGTVVARERVRYEADKLVSCELEEPLSMARGKATIQPDPKDPRRNIVAFEYSPGKDRPAKTAQEPLQSDTLMNDMIGPFVETHWNELMAGVPLKFRFIALARRETVGFKLAKESETTWRGKSAVILKMEPSSWVIAQLIDPLRFTVEKDAPHRVFQYVGRTTPRLQTGDTWKDLDAVTIFDW